jgi:hypothetical protein
VRTPDRQRNHLLQLGHPVAAADEFETTDNAKTLALMCRKLTTGADHADFSSSLAAHPAERAYTFLSNGKVIDLDALVVGLGLG